MSTCQLFHPIHQSFFSHLIIRKTFLIHSECAKSIERIGRGWVAIAYPNELSRSSEPQTVALHGYGKRLTSMAHSPSMVLNSTSESFKNYLSDDLPNGHKNRWQNVLLNWLSWTFCGRGRWTIVVASCILECSDTHLHLIPCHERVQKNFSLLCKSSKNPNGRSGQQPHLLGKFTVTEKIIYKYTGP